MLSKCISSLVNKLKVTCLITLSSLGSLSAATTLVEWGFNTGGDFEGWVDFQNRGSSTVSGGSLSGTAGGDVQIRSQGGAANPLLLTGNFVDAGDYLDLTFEVTISQAVANSVSIGFVNKEYNGAAAGNSAGLPVVQTAEGQNVTSANTFVTLTWDVKAILEAGDTTPAESTFQDAVLRGIRFDPINTNGGYSIDSMRLVGTAIPEPSTGILLGLASLALFRRSRG